MSGVIQALSPMEHIYLRKLQSVTLDVTPACVLDAFLPHLPFKWRQRQS